LIADPSAHPDDPFLEGLDVPYATIEDDVLYWGVPSSQTLEKTEALLHLLYDYPGIGVLTSDVTMPGERGGSISDATIDSIVRHIKCLLVSAFDAEGAVLWTTSSF
jgi:hypothetical protein